MVYMLTALITGTSTGIGRSTALRLARDGIRVWASMRDVSQGVSLEQISTEEKLDLQTIQLDVEDETSVNKAFQQIGNVDLSLIHI